jgi:hypothetical protein
MTLDPGLADRKTWTMGLEAYGRMVRMTVQLYAADGSPVRDPVHRTPLFELFATHRRLPGFSACLEQSLHEADASPVVLVYETVAAVGTAVSRNGDLIGATVAAYAITGHLQSLPIHVLARESGLPYSVVWRAARMEPPVPRRRLEIYGQLLHVLANALAVQSVREAG